MYGDTQESYKAYWKYDTPLDIITKKRVRWFGFLYSRWRPDNMPMAMGTQLDINQYILKYKGADFGAFITKCTIRRKSDL